MKKITSYHFKLILTLIIVVVSIFIYCDRKGITSADIMSKFGVLNFHDSNKNENKSENQNKLSYSNYDQNISIDIGNGIKMDFVLIQAGEFNMGSDSEVGDEDETPRHKVTITQPFYLGIYEVTQEQWQEIMGNNPSEFKGAKKPVDTVSFDDCQIFLNKLQEKTGKKFALPTEAQWEFACRAGTTTKWSFGDSEQNAEEYAWVGENSNQTTQIVGSKKPNSWGIYDMHGNIQEWCADWYNEYNQNDVVDPIGPVDGKARVVRGGGWGENPINVRSAYRNCNGSDGKNNGIGLRCVMLVN